MSKRKHSKNRPSRSLSRIHQDSPKLQAESFFSSMRGRILTLLGLSATAGALLLSNQEGERGGMKDSPSVQVAPKTISSEMEKQNKADFEKWAENFPLPTITIERSTEGHEERNLINGKDYAIFFEAFENEKAKLEQVFRDDMTTEEKQKTLYNFLSYVTHGYQKVEGRHSDHFAVGTPEFIRIVDDMEGFLAWHGKSFSATYDLGAQATGVQFNSVTMEGALVISGLEGYANGQGVNVPLFYLSPEKKHFLEKPDVSMGEQTAFYAPVSGSVLIDPKSVASRYDNVLDGYKTRIERFSKGEKMNFDPNSVSNGFSDMVHLHEGFHAALHLMGLDPRNKNLLKRRGDIDMGKYTLSERYYVDESPVSLHELGAHGFALMHSGKLAPLTAYGIVAGLVQNPSYKLSSIVFMEELFAALNLTKSQRELIAFPHGGDEITINFDPLAHHINQLHDEQLHEAGERMAKLAIYMARKDVQR